MKKFKKKSNVENGCSPNMKTNADFILFAVKQAKDAETFGFTRNICCRNLKTALHQYWQHGILGLHSLSQKARIPRSKGALNKPSRSASLSTLSRNMVIVNRLMDMKPLTKPAVSKLLKSWYHVRLVTRKEHQRLTKLKLRYTMPSGLEWRGHLCPLRRCGHQS